MRQALRPLARLAALLGAIALVGCSIQPGAGPSPEAFRPLTAQDTAGKGSSPFLWGVSTAGFQWEGHEELSQWARWDLAGKTEERRKNAADGLNRYAEDLDLTRGMGCNTFRTSIEWARVEPKKGEFDPEAIAHYRQLLKALRERGLTPIVTFMHFSYPAWLDAEGGWENPAASDAYARFVDRITREYGDLVDWYLTFNEPTVFVAGGYVSGQCPPGKKNDLIAAGKVLKHLVSAHNKAYDVVHRNDPVAKVAFNQYSASWRLLPNRVQGGSGDDFLDGVLGNADSLPKLDYMAIDYYTRLKLLPFELPQPWQWPVHPQGFYDSLAFYHRLTGKPVLVAENGYANEDGKPRPDGWTREAYLTAHVEQLQRAVKDGIPVLGYVHWSITDNYEWGSYRPRFGLFSVDCRNEDQRRVPTQAASVYRQIIAAGGVTRAIAKGITYPSSYTPLVRP
ncbi:glycoside hydrolase family 1 protein [bacterium]|nr:glycoside hydrolase family 1 protein [bacterium]